MPHTKKEILSTALKFVNRGVGHNRAQADLLGAGWESAEAKLVYDLIQQMNITGAAKRRIEHAIAQMED